MFLHKDQQIDQVKEGGHKIMDMFVSPLKIPITVHQACPGPQATFYRNLMLIDTPIKRYEESIFCRLVNELTPKPMQNYLDTVERTCQRQGEHSEYEESSGSEEEEEESRSPCFPSPSKINSRAEQPSQKDLTRNGYLSLLGRCILAEDKLLRETKTTKCTCKKSQCQKKYCECYKAGGVCGKDCECVGCENTKEAKQLEKPRKLKKMNPGCEPEQKTESATFCNCKKSGCVKNYCQCHSAGLMCSDKCNCLECKNKIEEMKMSKTGTAILDRALKWEAQSEIMKTLKKQKRRLSFDEAPNRVLDYL